MQFSKRPGGLRTILIAAVAAFAVSAAAASSAMAEVPGKWVNPGAVTMAKSTLTLKRDGANPKECTAAAGGTAANVGTEGNVFLDNGSPNLEGRIIFNCTGSTTLWLWTHKSLLRFTTEYFVDFPPGLPGWPTPYGEMEQETLKLRYVTPKEGSNYLEFKETLLGVESGGHKVTATGKLTLTRTGGAALVPTH